MVPPEEFSSSLPPPTLTVREMQVLASLVLGKTNREIGRDLFVSVGTVKTYMSSIFVKFGVSNRTEAAILGLEFFPTLGAVAS